MNSLLPEHTHVKVTTNARLHMGFMDLNGDLGRQFGSIGVSLNNIQTQLSITDCGSANEKASIEADGPDADRAVRYADQICQQFGISRKLKIELSESITPHAGLGSGTQLALAVGAALSTQFDLNLNELQIAMLLGRGKRSSIGINTFNRGGFHVDCGTCDPCTPPPVIFSSEFPSEWRFILLFDHDHRGLHGDSEIKAFQELAPPSPQDAATLCRVTLMQLIPALIEKDIQTFGKAITKIQAMVGDHFAPVQGGRFVSPAVREKLNWYANQDTAGYGQSSWGPTGFVICKDQATADSLVNESAKAFAQNKCQELVVSACNKAATIEPVTLNTDLPNGTTRKQATRDYVTGSAS